MSIALRPSGRERQPVTGSLSRRPWIVFVNDPNFGVVEVLARHHAVADYVALPLARR
jgi:hypothetical protein